MTSSAGQPAGDFSEAVPRAACEKSLTTKVVFVSTGYWSDAAHAARMAAGWLGGLSDGTPCGSGSTLAGSRPIRKWLPAMLEKYDIRKLADVGAGDMRWMRTLNLPGVDYRPYDLIPRDAGVERMDITREALAAPVHAVLCRHVLIHLDPPRIEAALRNIRASARYLIASHYPDAGAFDPAKSYNQTNLVKYLGEPLEMTPDTTEPGCYLAIWELLPRDPGAMLTIACVQVNNYCGRGHEYVRKLRDAVARNMTRPYRFVCLTDEQIDGVDCMLVPGGLKGWLAKIYLFEAFKEDPTLYLDLDTFVMGSLEPLLAKLEGAPEAVLRDFYSESSANTGVMYWETDLSYIWKEYTEAGCPAIATDAEWIVPRLPGRTQMVQDLIPGRVLSFKAHCNAVDPPADAALICFHGKPRPHEVGGWVSKAWDGTDTADDRTLHDLKIVVTTNTKLEQIQSNIEKALRFRAPFLDVRTPNGRKLAICASGPSLARYWDQIDAKTSVLALNGAYKFLVEKGRVPDYFAMLDARPQNVNFLTNLQNQTEHLLALQCDPAIFQTFVDRFPEDYAYRISKFALASPSCLKMVQEYDPKAIAFGGGATIGMTALALGAALGYRDVTLYGYESSFEGDNRRVWNQPQNIGEILIDVWVEDRKYITTPALASQVTEFRPFLAAVTEMFPDFEVKLMSDGLLRDYLAAGQRAI